jgi:hypothetical protein
MEEGVVFVVLGDSAASKEKRQIPSPWEEKVTADLSAA